MVKLKELIDQNQVYSVSIPQSGFLVVKLVANLTDPRVPVQVSIPQSGFLVVKPPAKFPLLEHVLMFQSLSRDSWWSNEVLILSIAKAEGGFNPSVGILGGQTSLPARRAIPLYLFQSLSRDSWWSNLISSPVSGSTFAVSIPQSGFLVVKPHLL